MARRHSMKLIPALTLVIFSSAADASGFQLLEQNASGIGNAYAGSAAVADNASTIYFNPAGMTQLQEREISGGLAAVNPSFNFHDQGSQVGALSGTGNGGDAGGWSFIPNGYASWALNKDLYVGIGIGAPFGLKTEYDDRWLGAAQATMFEVKTLNINPSVAYRLNDQVSLGAGVNWQRLEAEYTRQVGTYAGAHPVIGNADFTLVKSTMNLKDDAWGWNVGVLFAPSPSTKFGVSYRSEVRYRTTGDVQLSSDGSPTGVATMNLLKANGAESDLRAGLTLPSTLIMSLTHKLDDRWEILGDASRTGWSSIPKVDIMRTSGEKAQTLDTDFRDAWRLAVGANYQYNDAWKLKFGVAYDQTPVKRAETRLASLPDNDRVWLSLGAQWAPSKVSRLDLGATYIHVRDSKINNNQTSAATGDQLSRGIVTGEYSGNIWLFGAQYSMSF